MCLPYAMSGATSSNLHSSRLADYNRYGLQLQLVTARADATCRECNSIFTGAISTLTLSSGSSTHTHTHQCQRAPCAQGARPELTRVLGGMLRVEGVEVAARHSSLSAATHTTDGCKAAVVQAGSSD